MTVGNAPGRLREPLRRYNAAVSQAATHARIIDGMLAFTTASLFMDVRLPGRIPPFTLAAFISFVAYVMLRDRRPWSVPMAALFPLSIFISIHIGFFFPVH